MPINISSFVRPGHIFNSLHFILIALLEPTRPILEPCLLQVHFHVWSDEHAGDL